MALSPLHRYWLPVLLWGALIFNGSTDALSSRRTSRFLGPLLRFLKPDISEESFHRIQTVIRKGGHLSEYAVLAILIWRAVQRPGEKPPERWRWRLAFAVMGACALYAAGDEYHQSFYPSRYASFGDVAIDTAGAAAGLVLWRISGLWKKTW